MTSIFYIVSVGIDEPFEEYIMAISLDKKILENMIETNYKANKGYKLEIRENLKIFEIALEYDIEKHCDKYLLMYINYPGRPHNLTNLYAYNRIKRINHGLDYIIENSLVDLSIFYDKVNEITLFKDNLSANPISFDIYYEEGIMNA